MSEELQLEQQAARAATRRMKCQWHLAAQDLDVSDTHVALSAERKEGGCYVMVAFELTAISAMQRRYIKS